MTAPVSFIGPGSILCIYLLLNNAILVHTCFVTSEGERPALFCQASVHRLPLSQDQIPVKLAKLRILGTATAGRQHNGQLSAYNMTGLETLTFLEIGNFNLEHIHSDTFRAMRQLRVLDLSRNRITNIDSAAFNGLQLTLLSLTDNPGLQLTRGVFRGTEVHTLAARNCGLYELDYTTIAESKARQLSLAHNQIRWLDPQFASLIKPRDAHSPSIISRMDEWGLIDLTNNPLDCTCQLVWLPQLIEQQLYLSKRADLIRPPPTHRQTGTGSAQSSGDSDILTATPDTGTKRMYQLNLTCARPIKLAGLPIPHSWHLFCPKPKVVGIDVDLLTPRADHAQLTCIGQGQPPPSLAWTYHVNGHTVQKTLDSTAGATGTEIPSSQGMQSFLDTHQLYKRSIAVNVSLREPHVNNFTCTVWNEDTPKLHGSAYPFAMVDPGSFSEVPAGRRNQLTSPAHRMHEITVRIHGPNPLTGRIDQSTVTPESQTVTDILGNRINSVNVPGEMAIDRTTPSSSASTMGAIIAPSDGTTYDYLFTERYSLLQLLGAIFGTFIATLALLYGVTYCLSCACHLTPFALVKQLDHRQSTDRGGKPRKRWFFNRATKCDAALIKTLPHRPDILSAQNMSERTPLNGGINHNLNSTMTKTLNGDSAFSLLPSGMIGPSTVSVRRQPIPQALLMSGVPVPPSDVGSSTPPLNPAYWPMPEYTYTGTGSHEYDVPRPLDPSAGSKSLFRPSPPSDQQLHSPAMAHSFVNLTNPGMMPNQFALTTNGHQLQRNPLLLHSAGAATLSTPPFSNPNWAHTANGAGSIMSSLFAWGQADPHANSERQLPSISYAPYPTAQSTLYTGDYPTYLQTRPYPHHPQAQHAPTPLLELMTNSTQPFNPSPGSGPIDLNGRQQPGSQQEQMLQNDGHTTETSSSLNDSTS